MQDEQPTSNSNHRRAPLRLLACSGSLDGGGSERQLWQLVSRLDRQRFQSEVYLLHKRGPYLEQLPSDVPVHAFDAQFPMPPRFPPGRISWMQGRQLRQLVASRAIDIVYDRTFHMTMLTGWALPADQPRVSVIVSPPSRDLPATEHRFLRIKRWLLSRAYRRATLTIGVSSEVADDAARYYGLPRERIAVIHNPVDVERVRAMAATIDRPFNDCTESAKDDRTSLRIAVVGRFSAEKGHRLALESLKEFRARQLSSAVCPQMHFVGDGPQRSELETFVKQWSLTECVHFHGYQTNPYPFVNACNLVMIPSRYEGFPNVALEAMALGVPLMMTDYGATARMIAGAGNERAFLIPVDDSRQAARAMVDRLENPAQWQARAAVARTWIEREHALDPWLDKMMNLLEQLASRTGSLQNRRPA